MSGSGYALVSPPSLPFTLTPGNYKDVTVRLCAPTKGSLPGTFSVATAEAGQFDLTLSGNGVCAILLSKGWTLIGLPCVPASSSVADILQPIISDVGIAWGYPNQGWQFFDPGDPGGSTLKTIDLGKGYWIKMNAQRTLAIN